MFFCVCLYVFLYPQVSIFLFSLLLSTAGYKADKIDVNWINERLALLNVWTQLYKSDPFLPSLVVMAW